MMLEEAVRDGAQPIVGAGARLTHRILRARIVEAGQDDKRAIANVTVRVLSDGLDSAGTAWRRDRTPDLCVPRR